MLYALVNVRLKGVSAIILLFNPSKTTAIMVTLLKLHAC